MKVYRKILIGLLSITMMTTLFTGCGNQDDTTDDTSTEDTSTTDSASNDTDNNSDDETTTTTRVTLPDNIDYNTEITDGIVMNISGYDIDIEEYRYYFLNLKRYFDSGDESYWTGQEVAEVTDEDGNVTVEAKTAEEDTREKLSALKEHVITYLTNNYCVELLAKDNNISLTDDELKEVEENYNEIKKSYESEETRDFDTFEEYLNSTYCTKELYMKSLTRQALESKVIRALYEDDARENIIPQYYHCKHILLSTLNLQYETETAPDDATDEEKTAIDEKNTQNAEEAKSEIKKKAEEVLIKVNAGEDFDKLIAEYNEDPGETQNEDGSFDGYYFKSGSMVQEFEDAFMQLEDNQTSDIVETSYGYHIIKRLPLDEQYIDDNILSFIMYDMSTGETTQYYDDYVSKADEYNAKIEITFNDEYYNVNTNSVIPKSSKFAYAETPKTTEVAE
ncbi:MAG: peptidylprolyl isomerase [Oscillospiraceae bacterium]